MFKNNRLIFQQSAPAEGASEAPELTPEQKILRMAVWAGIEEPTFEEGPDGGYVQGILPNKMILTISYDADKENFNLMRNDSEGIIDFPENYDPGMTFEKFLNFVDRYFVAFPVMYGSAEEIIEWSKDPHTPKSRLQTYARLAGFQNIEQGENSIGGTFFGGSGEIRYDSTTGYMEVRIDGLGGFSFPVEGFEPGMTFEEFMNVAIDYFNYKKEEMSVGIHWIDIYWEKILEWHQGRS